MMTKGIEIMKNLGSPGRRHCAADEPGPQGTARARGFTLLEVLVAILVLSVGLLGLAGLQAYGTRHNNSAYLRTQANQQLYDMVDRMRANLGGADNGNYDAMPVIGANLSMDCTAVACTSAQMATYDMEVWEKANRELLPSGTGNIVNNGDGTFTVSVSWSEEYTREESHTAGTSLTRTVSLTFVP